MSNRPKICLRICCCFFALSFSFGVFGADGFVAGPLFSRFELTLDSGHRSEAIGPFFYDQGKDSEETWGVSPLFSHNSDPAVELKEDDLLYPLLTYKSFGAEYRWQFCQLLSFSGGEDCENTLKRHFTLFPVYFQQRSTDAGENYTALFPLYGHLENRLFHDDIFFVMFPIYGETRKRDVVTDNYLYPFFHLRHGDGLRGWQLWPLVGLEHKDVTTKTNGFNETEIIGGYDKHFVLWPVHFYQNTGIGTDNPAKFRANLPLYAMLRSPKRDSTSVLWPLFVWVDDREKKYREWDSPWPLIVFARGEGKTTTRIWPLFGRAHNDVLESDFYIWPLYKFNRLHTGSLDQQCTRILFYLFANTTEKNTETGAQHHHMDLWPLFAYRHDFNGNSRLQILAPIEPVLPNNRGIERNWSPLWSLWRSESNPKSGATSQSLLWNFYRRDSTPVSKKCSLLMGLFQYQSERETQRLRLFYIPVLKWHRQAGQTAK